MGQKTTVRFTVKMRKEDGTAEETIRSAPNEGNVKVASVHRHFGCFRLSECAISVFVYCYVKVVQSFQCFKRCTFYELYGFLKQISVNLLLNRLCFSHFCLLWFGQPTITR